MGSYSEYDFIVVGAGIFGATVAERLASSGKKVLVIDRRPHVAGISYSYMDPKTSIEVHQYGSHIFHTNDDEVWEYITRFAKFNNYIHTVKARHLGCLYDMPINLNTINSLFGEELNPVEAEDFINSKRLNTPCRNFEEKALSLVGEELYSAFLKGYTEKQWGTKATQVSADILSRIPMRFDTNNRYFASAKYQGIPVDGYGKLVKNMLSSENITVALSTDFVPDQTNIPVIYCGPVDELCGCIYGKLPYRSLDFVFESGEDQHMAVINEVDSDVPYTRVHDFKHYQVHMPEIINSKSSIKCYEYPAPYDDSHEAFYPIDNSESRSLYQKYVETAKKRFPNIMLGGRIGLYKYLDMDMAIRYALDMAKRIM